MKTKDEVIADIPVESKGLILYQTPGGFGITPFGHVQFQDVFALYGFLTVQMTLMRIQEDKDAAYAEWDNRPSQEEEE